LSSPAARLQVQWNRRWNFGVGYRRLSRKLHTNDLRTTFDADLVSLVIGFSM